MSNDTNVITIDPDQCSTDYFTVVRLEEVPRGDDRAWVLYVRAKALA